MAERWMRAKRAPPNRSRSFLRPSRASTYIIRSGATLHLCSARLRTSYAVAGGPRGRARRRLQQGADAVQLLFQYQRSMPNGRRVRHQTLQEMRQRTRPPAIFAALVA